MLYFSAMDRIGRPKPTRLFLKEWREHKNWSVRELALRMDVSAATVSKLETGDQAWTGAYLALLGHAFGLGDEKALLSHPKTPTQNELLAGLQPDEQQQITQLIKLFRRS